MDKAFSFSWKVRFSEQQYVDLHRGLSSELPFGRRALLGVVLLFSKYTMLIGILCLCLKVFGRFMSRFFPGVSANSYREMPFVRHKTTYLVDEQGLTVKSRGRKIFVRWSGIGTWQQKNGCLSVGLPWFPQCLFRISDLKQAGVYDQVVARCRTHGKKKRR
jgi:hypothetical protein